MNLKEVRELITLMNEHQLVEVELEREGTKIRLRKAGAGMAVEGVEPVAAPRVASAAHSGQAEAPEVAPAPAGVEVKSPMVGTFYRAPAPEAPPFVEVGQEIQVGQVLCIIEAMKLMNEIKSEIKGRITRILVENTQPVEFGQVLFLVEPS